MRTLSASLVVTLSFAAAPAMAQDPPQPGYPQPGYAPQAGSPQPPAPGYEVQAPPPGYQQPPPGYGPGQAPEGQPPQVYEQQANPPEYGGDPQQQQPQQPGADPGEELVGYDDAGLEAVEQQSLIEASGYVDDGYDPEAYVDFQQSLAPYGQWENDPTYGQVWAPSPSVVGAGFSPYSSGGHWALTEYGWTWVSDWDWGWAPFHYGRWSVFGNRGWCWIPGRVWGPAWVGWRWGRGYAGWAPLAPRRMTVPPPPPAGMRSYWRFTPTAGLGAQRINYVTARTVHAAFAATSPMRNVQVLNRYHVEAGPPPHMVAAAMGRSITPTTVRSYAQAAPRGTITPRSAPAALTPGFSHNPMARPFAPGSPTYHAQATRAPSGAGYQPMAPQGGRYQGYPQGSSPSYRYNSPSPSPGTFHQNAPSAPSYHYNAPSAPSYRAPSYSPPSYSRPSAPSYSPPSYSRPSAPSYSPPSYSRPSTPSYSAPSYSRPSTPSVSRPSFGGGGGFRGGHR